MGRDFKDLERGRQTTMTEIARLRKALEYEVDASEDEADPDIVEREKNLALLRTMENKLESIEYAIQAARKGTYGTCENCGKPIDPARLAALPEATLCITCKVSKERKSRGLIISRE